MRENLLGKIVADRYEVKSVLGAGSSSVVYRAIHTMTKREVALKLLNPELAKDELYQKRFLREAQSTVRLKHPNVVEVLDMGQHDDRYLYLAMENLEGETLEDLLDRESKLPPNIVVERLTPIMSALVEAHTMGLVHRDLKPSNIFLHQHQGVVVPKLLDFGVVKDTTGSSDQTTQAGTLIGSPFYMSPEQAKGSKSITAQADVWSMGVVFYRCLTGKLPFYRKTLMELIDVILSGKYTPIGFCAPDVSMKLNTAVERALIVDPAARYPDMQSFLDALAELTAPVPVPVFDRTVDMSADIPQARISARPRSTSRPLIIGGALIAIATTLAVGQHLYSARSTLSAPLIAPPSLVPPSIPAPKNVQVHKAPESRAARAAALATRKAAEQRVTDLKAAARRAQIRARAAEVDVEALLTQEVKDRDLPQLKRARATLSSAKRTLSRCALSSAQKKQRERSAKLLEQERYGDAKSEYEKLDTSVSATLARCAPSAPALSKKIERKAPLPIIKSAQLPKRPKPKRPLAIAPEAPRSPKSNEAKYAFEKARALRTAGKLSEAIKAVEKAIALNPKFSTAHNLLGLLLQRKGDAKRAVLAFDRAIALEPGNPILLGNRGRAQLASGNYKKALLDFDQAIAQSPGQANLHYERATTRSKLGDHRGALTDLEKTLSLSSANVKAQYLKARCLEKLGQRKDAILSFTKTLEIEPRHEGALLWRGLTYIALKKRPEAKRDFERFLKVAPKSKHRATVERHLSAIKEHPEL